MLPAFEQVEVALVAQACHGDRAAAPQVQRLGAAAGLQQRIDHCVDAAQKYAGDAVELARIAATREPAPGPGRPRATGGQGLLQRKDQRHVDVEAARRGLGECLASSWRSGDFDEQIGTCHSLTQADRCRYGTLRVVCQLRTDLEADPASVTGTVGVQARQGVAGVLHIVDRQSLVTPLGTDAGLPQTMQVVGVAFAAANRLLEDRRIGGDALHAGLEVGRQLATLHQLARQVVEPKMLAEGEGLLQGRHARSGVKGESRNSATKRLRPVVSRSVP